MLGTLRVLRKDLLELLDGVRGILLVLVLPAVLLLLVGQLRVQSQPLQMLVAGEATGAEEKEFEAFLQLLEEIAGLEIELRDSPVVDPLETTRHGGFDLLLNIEGDTSRDWVFYTAETNRLRFVSLEQFVAGLDRALRVLELAQGDFGDPGTEFDAEIELLKAEIFALSAAASDRLVAYFPRAADRATDVVVRTAALILCFLPFVLAAPSLIREREAHTLEPLLAAPGIGPGAVMAGKALYALVVSLFNWLLMLVLVQSFYSLDVKSGLLQTTLFLLPALLSSALLGLAVSALARSQSQVIIAAALYFLGMTLFSGFLYPIEEASGTIQALSSLFSLTFVHPILTAWMLGAGAAALVSPETAALWAQVLVMGLGAVLAVRRSLRHI